MVLAIAAPWVKWEYVVEFFACVGIDPHGYVYVGSVALLASQHSISFKFSHGHVGSRVGACAPGEGLGFGVGV